MRVNSYMNADNRRFKGSYKYLVKDTKMTSEEFFLDVNEKVCNFLPKKERDDVIVYPLEKLKDGFLNILILTRREAETFMCGFMQIDGVKGSEYERIKNKLKKEKKAIVNINGLLTLQQKKELTLEDLREEYAEEFNEKVKPENISEDLETIIKSIQREFGLELSEK